MLTFLSSNSMSVIFFSLGSLMQIGYRASLYSYVKTTAVEKAIPGMLESMRKCKSIWWASEFLSPFISAGILPLSSSSY